MRKMIVGSLAFGSVLLAVACGGGQTQSPECKDYLACDAKTTKSGSDATYGAMGTCWTTTDAAAKACTDSCKSALDSLKSAYPDAGC